MDTLVCGPDKYIEVDHYTLKPGAGQTIRFENTLTPSTAADIEFYRAGTKDSSPVPGFCDGVPGGVYTVPAMGGAAGGVRTCTVNSSATGIYQYTITASNHEELDPVIIIEEPDLTSIVVLVTAAATAGVTNVLTRRSMERARAAESRVPRDS